MKKFFLSVLCLTLFVSAVFLASGCRQKTTHVHSFTNYVSDNNATTEKDGTKTAHCDYEGCTATDTITDEGSKLESKISFKTLSMGEKNINGNIPVYGKVPNAQKTYSFIDEVKTAGNVQYIVSLDIYGIQQVATKTIPLNEGDNVVYITEQLNDNPRAVYEITIRRKPLYTVSFDTNGGTAVDSQVVEEDSIIPAPVTTKIGYTFINWNFDFSQPITENAIITAKFKVKDEMSNFNFRSSAGECTITRIKDKTVSEIIIPDYVTSIGYSAFAYCGGITHITIGKGITSIYSEAFRGCSALTSITIPDSVTFIGSDAFRGCSALTSITIPDSVTFIGGYAFYGCNSLTSITIPDSITVIGESAFYDCISLAYNEYDNAYYLGNDKNKYLALIKAKDEIVTSCNINENCKLIGDSAFRNCSKLTSVTIPDSVTSIDNSAFSGCSGLTSATIPDSVTSIGSYAFSGCSGLTSVTIPDSVTSIGNSAFSGCSGLTSVTIGNGVTSVDDFAFSGCSGLTNVTIGNSVTSIGDSAFVGCNNLTSITIPDGVTSIGNSAFIGCSGLTSITIGNGVTSIGYYAFLHCDRLRSVTIGNGVTSIGDSVFEDCDRLKSVTIGNGVTSISKSAFIGCYNLTIVNYLGTIDQWAEINFEDNPFWDTKNLYLYINNELITKVILTTANKISAFAFYGCSKFESLTIGNSVTSIGDGAFYDCSGLTNVTIGNSVTSIGDSAFVRCNNLTSITVDNSNQYFTSIDGNLYNKDRTKLIQYAIGKTDSSFIIPDSVTSIGHEAFSGCSGLTNVTIPDSVTSIGDSAFSGCSSLTSITIPDSVTSIGDFAFDGCNSLAYNEYDKAYYLGNDKNKYVALIKVKSTMISSCKINDNCRIINRNSFSGCCRLTSVTIPDGVTSSIGYEAFKDCSALTSVIIGNGVTSIGNWAFYGCSSLTSVTIGNGVTSIGNSAFYGCSPLTSVNYLGTIDQWAEINFEGNPLRYTKKLYINNESITKVILTTANKISAYAFYGCSGLTSITIPDSVTSIGDSAFSGCSGLTSITIPDNVTFIGESVFYGCSSLTSVTIGNGVTSIGDYAFIGCSGLTSVSIGNGVTSIGYEAFYDCSALTIITIGNGVASIGYEAFYGCNGLKTVFYKGTEEQWNNILIDTRNNYLVDANIYYSESESTHNLSEKTYN